MQPCCTAAREASGGRKCYYAKRADPFRAYLLPARRFPVQQAPSNLFPRATFRGDSSHLVLLGRPCSRSAITITAPYNADKKMKYPMRKSIRQQGYEGGCGEICRSQQQSLPRPSSQVPAASCLCGRRLGDAAVG